jgi:RNA polymerase sigma-70 factor (ECF subfamily)
MRPVNFSSTVWATIEQAKENDPRALAVILERYRPPILQFAMNRGMQSADAEDVTQEVFARIIEKQLLKKAHAAKGKFRSLLLAITRHVITEKRRGERRNRPLDDDTLVSSKDREEEFDRLWALNLIRLALERLKDESSDKGTPYHDALLLALEGRETYAKLAAKLGKTEKDMMNYVQRGLAKIRGYFEAGIKDYSAGEDEYREEQEYLTQFFDPTI